MSRTLERVVLQSVSNTVTDVYTVPAGAKFTIREITGESLSGLAEILTILIGAGKYYAAIAIPTTTSAREPFNGVAYAGEVIKAYSTLAAGIYMSLTGILQVP